MSDDNNLDLLARFREAQTQVTEEQAHSQKELAQQAPEIEHPAPEQRAEFVKSKGFYRSYTSAPVGADLDLVAADMAAGAKDLIGSRIHRYLYDRPPQELITSDKENPNLLYIKSDIPETSPTLEEIGKQGKSKKIEGFARLVASCHMLGEGDYRPSDIAVQTQKDAAGKSHLVFDKRSNSGSFESSITDFDSLVGDTAAKFDEFSYSADIKKGKLSFGIDEYSKSLKEMTAKLSGKTDSLVESAVGELARVEFEPEFSGMSKSMQKAVEAEPVRGLDNDLDKLKVAHKDLLATNLENMKKISEKLDIISRFSDVDVNKKFGKNFKKGGWVQEFADSPVRDPVKFACRHDIKIDGKNALQWAYENNYEATPGKPFYKEYLYYESLLAKDESQLTAEDKKFIEVITPESANYHHDKIGFAHGVSTLSRSDREFIGQAAEQGLKFDDTRSFADLGIKGLESKKSMSESLAIKARAVLSKGVKSISMGTSPSSPSSTPGRRPNAGKGTQR